MVQRNVEQIRSMVLDILYYAKDRELTLSSIDVAGMVEGVRLGLQKKAGDFDVALEIKVAPNSGSFQGDPQAIRAMLLNILENSFDACRADREKPNHRVGFEVRREAPWMIFEITDDGIGMDQETREKLFSLFFSSKGIKGTGLGLFISKKIVDKHGGEIEAESELGQGTRFLIRLPLEARPSTKPAEV
jgi:signal transduction histidine kinase